ncbi:beta-ketoacyl synthase chain length factor [Parafilimonas terrae]|uniref:Beta-ketoacyl synthase, N-terminal domain n=1 Tax=Parafilimonas terrae TaxID=1465490 RepID=A0A1I5UB26_9BACT|nr:beta-ketoacyl synthase chain length factor [Parafilimonas terrae]SFP92137.1 Beta-ketoacyl synthase, N-terminal domain [Parafilimonas terrae]
MEEANIYINAVAGISPQSVFNEGFSQSVIKPSGNRFVCMEPDYDELIDAKLIRRMSRIIKMGTAAALKCLQQANVEIPGGIVMGTAYGCLQDTEIFLKRIIDYKEEMLTPTAFIQSTHNTVGAQIALLLQCHNYNNTFVQSGHSFESALLDGALLLKEDEMNEVLVGAADEITPASHAILERFGLYKKQAGDNGFYNYTSKGTVAGEGACFFLLSNVQGEKNIAKLNGIETFLDVPDEEVENKINQFLAAHHLSINDIDLIIAGRNGDKKNDAVYDMLDKNIFTDKQTINYKHLCGEYPTSSSFALWLALKLVKDAGAAQFLCNQIINRDVKKILIYNHYLHTYHSLLLAGAC